MLRRMLNFTRTKAVPVLRPASRWACCLVLMAACGGDATSTPAAPPPLPAAPAKVEPTAPVEPVLPLPMPEPAVEPATPEADKAPEPSADKAKVAAAKEDEVVSKKGAAANEPEGKKKAPEPTPVAKPDTKADPKAEPKKGETLTAKVTPPTPAPKPAPKPEPTPKPASDPKADTQGTATKPVMQPPPPTPPAPVAYEMPSSAHVRIEAPKGLEADLAKDTRMKPWLQKSVAAATKCYEVEAKTTPKLTGTIEVGIVMHENDRPDAAIKKLPPQLSGVFACVSGAMMKSRMPLFVGKEGQKYTAKVVFKP